MTKSPLAYLHMLMQQAPQCQALCASLAQAHALLTEEARALESIGQALSALAHNARQQDDITQHLALQLAQQHQRHADSKAQPGQATPDNAVTARDVQAWLGSSRHAEYAVIQERLAWLHTQTANTQALLKQIDAHPPGAPIIRPHTEKPSLSAAQVAQLRQHSQAEESAQRRMLQLWRKQ